jgi:uncharacterized Zn-binding protein involved in type VI secretion
MPAAARKGDQVSTGHSCDSTTEIEFGEESVIIGGKQAAYEGAGLKSHTILVGKDCVPHATVVNAGSQTVEVKGKPLARKNDSACAGTISQGDESVVVG